MPAAKYDFTLTAVTNLLTTYKRNAIAIFVHCNRAGDPAARNVSMFKKFMGKISTILSNKSPF